MGIVWLMRIGWWRAAGECVFGTAYDGREVLDGDWDGD
jgi:hypothetical protein